MSETAITQIPEDVLEGWHVFNDQTADWAIRKIADARADTDSWKNYYKQQLDAIKKGNEDTELFFTKCLQDYFTTVPHKVTKTGQHKYSLPSGDLVVKPQEPEYELDDTVIVAWLMANGMEQFIERKPTVKWAELKKVIAFDGETAVEPVTGEVIPGITAHHRDDKFSLTIKKG